jgi:hypothetical protein
MMRKFLNIVVAIIEGLRRLPKCLFETLFSCQCPFNESCKLKLYVYKNYVFFFALYIMSIHVLMVVLTMFDK